MDSADINISEIMSGMGVVRSETEDSSEGPLHGNFDYLLCISLECTCDDDARTLPREDMEVCPARFIHALHIASRPSVLACGLFACLPWGPVEGGRTTLGVRQCQGGGGVRHEASLLQAGVFESHAILHTTDRNRRCYAR